MEQFSQAVSEIKNKFEGGVSFSVNWNDLAAQARREMMKKINPRSAKRRVPVYGGVSIELPAYTCPDDVSVPAEFYPNDNSFSGRGYKYRAPKPFYQSIETGDNVFTIDYLNGKPLLLARSDRGQSTTVIDAIDPADFTGVSLTATARNYLSGTGAVYGTFTDSIYEITHNYTTAQDFSTYALGVMVVPFYTEDVSKVEYVSVQLQTDPSNYYEVESTVAGINDNYFDHWNLARLDMAKKTNTGSPDLSNINTVVIAVKMNTGESQEVTIDMVQLHLSQSASFEYYSTKIFQGTDGTFKLKPDADTDIILLQEEEYDIWFYEMCNLIVQDATYDGIDSKESVRFEQKLATSYELYNMRFPSMEEPMTYNISSEVDLESYDYQGI